MAATIGGVNRKARRSAGEGARGPHTPARAWGVIWATRLPVAATASVGEEDAGVGGTRVADRRRAVVEQRLGPHAERLGEAPSGTGVDTRDHDVVERVGRRARRLEGVGESLLAEGGVDALAKALLPT